MQRRLASLRASAFLTIVALALIVSCVSTIANDISPYFQAESLSDYDYANCKYLQRRAEPPLLDTFNEWVSSHTSADGSIRRETEISFAALDFLSIYLSEGDLADMWHQIFRYGPIKDFLTLSKLRGLSAESWNSYVKPAPRWTISEGEAFQIRAFFDLKMGTYNGKWPYLDE